MRQISEVLLPVCHSFAVIELTEEEKQQIINSEDFARFFDRSTRLIERAMSEEVNIFTDYTGGDGEDHDRWEIHRLNIMCHTLAAV